MMVTVTYQADRVPGIINWEKTITIAVTIKPYALLPAPALSPSSKPVDISFLSTGALTQWTLLNLFRLFFPRLASLSTACKTRRRIGKPFHGAVLQGPYVIQLHPGADKARLDSASVLSENQPSCRIDRKNG